MKSKKIKKVVGSVVFGALVVVLAALFLAVGWVLVQMAQGKTPSLFGYRFYYVLTDSMTPTYAVGDVVLGKEVSASDVDQFTVGTVVTYTAEFGEMAGNQVTHRIVEGVHYDETLNDYVVTTRGDKAGAALDKPVRLSRINAVVSRKMVVVSWIYGLVRNGFGFLLLFIAPLGIMLVVLIVRLVLVIHNDKTKGQQPDESNEKTAERIDEIKRKAIEEYKKAHENTNEETKND